VILLSKLDPDLVRDAERIRENVGPATETGSDLRCALEVQPTVVPHPIGVAAILAEADAQQHVVRVVVFGAEEMRVVGGDDREIQFVGEREDALIQDRLALRLVRLDFEVVAILEDVGVPVGGFPRAIEVVRHQMRRDFAGQAGGGDDDPLRVFGEQLAVDARLGIEAFGIGERRQLDQVAIAGHVAGQQN